ncbi:protein TASOR 2 isoform X5 [Sciurus carolinensis]|uniref:protein TASOR 2 isoform X5 n=1 Tax=Sciurus carolinensis TaxID=30640 RepID=UPI001FB3F56B|nr:protein TASOR 2 isoform X5 [Sciurus carolinensis]XP_047375804.1 protein TASOR 2 isoform X5 [Sciurus carolinensis]
MSTKLFTNKNKPIIILRKNFKKLTGFFCLKLKISIFCLKAKLVCQRGLCVGSSAITTLGDPAKGVYISKYSDYLHPRPWYHGKSGYVVIFNLIKGKVKFVSENYTTNYTRPSSGYDCHVAADTNKVSHKTSHFRAFELSQYYLYELSGNTVIKRPRQICPYVIVAFQYREPKTMAVPAHKSIVELSKNVLSPWKGQLIIQGCVLCDITLWSTYGTIVPTQLPQELDFKYVMKVSSLKKRLPEAAFKKQNYSEQKVSCQNLCFDLYEVELSNKQGERIDKLTDYIKNKQLAIIKCLEDRGFFILLTSSALIPEPTNFVGEQMGLHGLYLFHSHLSTGVKDLKIEDDISLKVIPLLPALNCALLEAKKALPEEGTRPNTLVKHNFQELYRVDKSPSLTVPRDGMKKTAFFGKSSSDFDLVPPPEKCPVEFLTQLRSYFSDPSGYTLEVSTALDFLAEHPQSPCISDGICDAGFSLVMTPDPEFLDSEVEIRKETETEKNSEEILRVKKGTVVPLSPASNLRVQPKRKASMPLLGQSKRVNLCRPLPKRTVPGTDSGSRSPTTLKLVKGQFPQKRKRGAEVLTAQFVQKTKLDRKNQEASISKDVPVATNAKRARKQEKSPVKTVSRAKPPMKKSPQKQRVNVVKGNQNPRIRKQPQPAKGETALQLQSNISSDDQKDGININTDQPESTTVVHEDLSENSIMNYDSQALNMLADLALSSATSCTPSCEPRILPCSSELPQNDVLLCKENSLHGTSDHEYHRGVKSQKGVPLPKLSSDRKSNSGSDLIVNQEEECLVPCPAPDKAQSPTHEETVKSSDANQNSLVAVEHSYALLLAEHSKKHLQQRGLPGPAFAKNGTKGPEAGTPVGKVMPFRHLHNTSPLQKVSSVDSLIKRKNRFVSSHLKDFYCSHSVLSCDGSFKVTFTCETEYAFNLDSKYTNNPLEKTVVRALHGPWNTNLPDNVEEVKLLLHMWVALFYSNQNKVLRSSRKVVEHSNPAKYVSINSTLESFELSEIEESSSVERCSVEPVLETNETSRGHAAEMSFPGPNCLLPLIKPPPARGLELCVQNEQKETFETECHTDNSENQNFIYSCNNEVIMGKAKQESSDKLETSNLVLSGIENMQTNGPSIAGEEKTFQLLENTAVASYDTVTQATFTTTYDEANSHSGVRQKSAYDTLENKVDVFHAAVQPKTSALQDLTQHSSPINDECQSSLERTDDDMEYVMINLEPVTLTFEKNACVPIHSEVNRPDKSIVFDTELIKQVSPAMSPRHPIATLEKVQTQGLRDVPSLAVSGQKATNHLSASSVSREALAQELCSLQKEKPLPVSSPPSNKALIMEALSLARSSNYPLPSEEMKGSQDCSLQTQSVFSVTSEEIIEPSQIEVVSSSASATLGKGYSHNCIPPGITMSDGSLEIRKNDKSNLSHENTNVESLTSTFAQQISPSMSREETSLELSEEDSDIDLTLTISPPTSPKEEMATDEIEQLQEAPVSNLELQDIAEEIVQPEEVTLVENRKINSASYMSVCPVVSEEPLENKEIKSDSLQPVTLILSKENCTLEIAEEINVTSDFPFDSLIEEVSPPSSPDPPVATKETRPSQAVSPCSLDLHGIQCEKSNKLYQIGSGDLAVTEKENSFVSPNHPMGQGDLSQVQQIQFSAEIPLMLTNNPGRKGRPILPGKVTEEIVPNEHNEGFSFSEKMQCCNAVLNKSASAARYRGNVKPSVEKLVKSGNPLQPISIENRNLDLQHLVLESSEPSFSSKKIIENKTLTDQLVSTTALSGIVNVSLKQKTNPKSITKNLFESDLKTDAGGYMQVKSTDSASIDRTDVTQTYMHPESPKLGSSSDSTIFTHCTQPGSVEPGFQTQEISVVRMANLLKNSETKPELHEESTDLGTVSLHSNSTSSTKGEQKINTPQDTSTCEIKELLNGGFFPMYAGSYQNTADTSESISKETSASSDSLVCGISKEHIDNKSPRDIYRAETDFETQSRDTEMRVNSDMHYEPLSGDSDQDSLDCRNPKLDMEDSCTMRNSHTSKKEGATKDSYESFLNSNNSDNEAWSYKRVPGLETSFPPRNRTFGLKQEDKCVPSYVQIRDLHGIPRTYANFTITKEFKDTSRTLHSLRRQPGFTANCSLLSSWTSTWQVADDLTQNTLDLEYLRFAHKIKQIVKGDSQKSTSSPNIFPKESPTQIMVGTLPLTKIPEAPVLHPASKSRSPILVTIVHPDARQQSQHRRGHTPTHMDSTSSFWKERCSHSRNLTNSQKNQTVSFHLNKLKYNSTLKESRNDISLILNEYAEFNKVMMNSNQVLLQDKELNVASGEAMSQEVYPSFPRQSASYEDMITDLCASLHVKLKSVMKEACKSPFLFYLVETEEKSFFLRTKNILRKGGHTEIEPQHFCQAFHRENDKLIVIIRNEDLSSHLHQIPSLLKLKHFPNVIFAGIDSPEDVVNDTYQELFHTGGFVISDDKILEHLTLVQLKDIVKILEKLNGNGRWKWLLHYRENKKLKEDIRMDSIAHKKNLILKSYQSANIIELLHYHHCDSRSPTKAEILKCLINLQVQHVEARFAVFLTDKPTVSREVFENSGILVTDVNNFIENIQKVAAPFRSSYW